MDEGGVTLKQRFTVDQLQELNQRKYQELMNVSRWKPIFDWKENNPACQRCGDVDKYEKFQKSSMIMCRHCLSNFFRVNE